MNHATHEPGTVADCEECRKVALEPGWYKLLRGLTSPDAAEGEAGTSGGNAGNEAEAGLDLSKVEAERAKTRIDLSKAHEGKPVVDLPESEEQKRADAAKRKRGD